MEIDEKCIKHILQVLTLYGYSCESLKQIKHKGYANVQIKEVKKL